MNALVSYLLGAAAIVAVAGGIYQAGRSSAQKECNAAALAAELKTVRADLDAERVARADAVLRGTSLEAENAKSAERLRKIEDEDRTRTPPASSGSPSCGGGWTDDDARRVRGGSARPAGSR